MIGMHPEKMIEKIVKPFIGPLDEVVAQMRQVNTELVEIKVILDELLEATKEQ